jgi:hypothetical protein
MTEVTCKTGLSRESLYKALSAEGNPEFAKIIKVMRALDLKITARGRDRHRTPPPNRHSREGGNLASFRWKNKILSLYARKDTVRN